MSERLPVLSGTQLISALAKLGWVSVRQRGSHVRLKHPDRSVSLVVPPRPSSRIGRSAGVAGLLWICVACGSSAHHSAAPASVTKRRPPANTNSSYRAATSTPSPARRRVLPHRMRVIGVLPAVRRQGWFRWTPAVAVRGQTAVWISRVKAYREAGFTVTLLRWHQSLVTLVLNPGSSQPGGAGWPYGDMIGPAERRTVVAAFNSAFQENYGAGGFEEGGQIGWPLRRGKASVVIYRDGFADIGRWKASVPAPDRPVAAVRQNLGLLIDAGRVAPTVDRCIKVCWGDPLHEQPIVARSGLGVSADGDLIWAGGHNLSVRALAEALAGSGAVRAMELDINPRWVAGYVYAHPRYVAPLAIPLVPGQTGIPGQFLVPYFRDFFSVVVRAR